MFGTSWHIGRIFGIPLRIHISWFLVFALVVWSLARYYFPAVLSQSPPWEYWVLGVVAALLLFASVLVHELGHCLVALRYRIPIAQITLFIFGGMAQIRREAPTPKAEFQIAIAGPIVSVGVGLGAWDMVAGLAIGGVWFLLIGAFLYTAAHNTHRQVAFQESLMGLRVGDVMTPEVVVLEAGMTLDEAVNNYFLRFGYGGFPVVDNGRLVGVLSLKEIKAIPRYRWGTLTVGEVMAPHSLQAEIHPDEPITAAMERMVHDDRSRLVVRDGGRVLGVVTRSGIARFLDLRQR